MSDRIVAIDYETIDSRGASFEYFRSDFSILSLSAAWRSPTGEIKQWFSADPVRIKQKLLDLANAKDKIVAHNLPYEYGVTAAVHPGVKLNWYADTMRLTQIRDGGGDEFNPPELTLDQSIALELGEMTEKTANKLRFSGIGLSLEACAKRFLPDASMHDHKDVAHKWLEEHAGITKNFGGNLHLLPPEILEAYNNADTLVTLLLFEEHTEWAAKEGFDWKPDHRLYLMRGREITAAYARGIIIDREALYTYILEIEQEIVDIEKAFEAELAHELELVSKMRYEICRDWANDPNLKSERARIKRRMKLISGDMDDQYKTLNLGSSKQLAMLFIDIMGMEPQFHTKKGSPSFKTTHLHQWGPGGEILQKRRKRLLVLQQCVNTYVGSLYDGRVHCSVRVSGTRTNRVAGGRDA